MAIARRAGRASWLAAPHRQRDSDTALPLPRCVVRSKVARPAQCSSGGRIERRSDVNQHAQRA